MKLRFEYSSIFDSEIAELTGKKIDESLTASMDAFIPRLTQQWQERGQPLVDRAVELSGLAFKQSEAKCTLTLSDFVSMSHPLIVNVKKYLNGSADAEFLNEVIFHELLHVLLTDNWQVWPTSLIQKHSADDEIVAAHLHLMAIERGVHNSLQNYPQLQVIDEWYRRIGNGYDIAWETVSRDNLFQEFIAELRDESQWALRA